MVSLKLSAGQQAYVVSGQILLPRTGAWLADLKVDTRDELPDQLTLDLGDVELPAAVTQADLIAGMTEVRLIGGHGGLGDMAKKKHYYRPLTRHVLNDLLRDCGESLSALSTAAILSKALEAWTTMVLPTGTMLAALCLIVGNGANWRVLANGTVWVGQETWPDSGVDARTTQADGPNAAAIVGTDIPGLWPGTLLNGRRVDNVRHDLADNRTTVLFAPEGM